MEARLNRGGVPVHDTADAQQALTVTQGPSAGATMQPKHIRVAAVLDGLNPQTLRLVLRIALSPPSMVQCCNSSSDAANASMGEPLPS
jgi:hypothetical protein